MTSIAEVPQTHTYSDFDQKNPLVRETCNRIDELRERVAAGNITRDNLARLGMLLASLPAWNHNFYREDTVANTNTEDPLADTLVIPADNRTETTQAA